MAQYDGSIRINTNISTKDAKVQLSALQHTIVRTADEIASLRSRMDALKDQKIPTERYKQLQEYIDSTKASIGQLTESMRKMEADGQQGTDVYKDYADSVEEMSKELEKARDRAKELVETGKAFTLGKDSDEYKGLAKQLGNEQKALAKMTAQYAALGGQTAVENAKNAFRKLGDVAKNASSKISKYAKRSGGAIASFGSRLKSLALSALIFNQISKVFGSMSSGIREGFGNVYREMDGFKGAVDGLKASTTILKNSLAAAFRPLVEIAIPYIQKAIEYITRLADAFGQLMAAITGQKKYTKAIKQTTSALEEAKEAEEGYLSPLDEINKYQKKDSQSGSGGASGTMFEEVPIDSKFMEMADRIKETMAQLFQPLKSAWENQGQFVMDSWKYALEEIGILAESVGKDFLAVLNQLETVSVLENILIIVGDIGLVVGSLAARFREAWEANDSGLRILESIRDLFGTIIEHIRNAADYTVE